MSSTFERFRPISSRRNPTVTGSYSDPIRNIDWVLMGSVISLVVIGLFTVFSATYRRLAEQGFDPYVYTQRQAIFVVVAGVVLALVMTKIA
jgi:cell division protein FtsW (lipid II flippase)